MIKIPILPIFAGSILGTIGAWWIGGGTFFQYLFVALGALFWLDFVLGTSISVWIRNQKLSSKKMKRSLIKMMQYFFLLVLAYIIDGVSTHATGAKTHSYILEIGVLLSAVMHEATSVLEHLKSLEKFTGFKIPDFVGDKIEDVEKQLPKELKDDD